MDIFVRLPLPTRADRNVHAPFNPVCVAKDGCLPDLSGKVGRPFITAHYDAMSQTGKKTEQTTAQFNAKLHRMKASDNGVPSAFVILPADASAILPRRGRTTVQGRINGCHFQALLEPDGRKSHWLRLDPALMEATGVAIGEEVSFELEPVALEPEPNVPGDFLAALEESPEARKTWKETTTLARVDWVHWIDSAKREATRQSRISDACDMLAAGKKRVCCFDPSGYYSKALGVPEPDEGGA